MTIFSNCCQRELPPALWYNTWTMLFWQSGHSPSHFAFPAHFHHPVTPILAPVTPPTTGLLPSHSPLLQMPATNPEPVPMPIKDLKPEPTAEPEQAQSDQVCEWTPISIQELKLEPLFIPEPEPALSIFRDRTRACQV